MDYETLTNGDFKLLIEPIVYLTYQGNNFAMTAHECALYDELVNGDIWRKFTDISHKNLPLALFLERGGLGIPAWTGTTTGRVTNAQIKQALGVGIVSFKEDEDEEPEPEVPDVVGPDLTGRMAGIGADVYRVDTDVITSFWITDNTGRGISPDDGASVTITVGDTPYHIPYVVPPGDTTLVWVKWHTPSAPTTVTITADCTAGRIQDSYRRMKVVELNFEEPPNPEGRDLRDGWTYTLPPAYPSTTANSWSEWSPWWQENWEWEEDWEWESTGHSSSCADNCTKDHGHWVDNGEWVDNGWWEYDQIFYRASLDVTPKLSTYSKTSYTDFGKLHMKSGYGCYIDVATDVSCNDTISNYTPAQTVVTAFPEFRYLDYFRVLEVNPSSRDRFRFQKNLWSQFEDFLHFTPIWYPDDQDFPVQVVAIDCWTPAGMLCQTTMTDNMVIDGNVYDDWYIAPNK